MTEKSVPAHDEGRHEHRRQTPAPIADLMGPPPKPAPPAPHPPERPGTAPVDQAIARLHELATQLAKRERPSAATERNDLAPGTGQSQPAFHALLTEASPLAATVGQPEPDRSSEPLQAAMPSRAPDPIGSGPPPRIDAARPAIDRGLAQPSEASPHLVRIDPGAPSGPALPPLGAGAAAGLPRSSNQDNEIPIANPAANSLTGPPRSTPFASSIDNSGSPPSSVLKLPDARVGPTALLDPPAVTDSRAPAPGDFPRHDSVRVAPADYSFPNLEDLGSGSTSGTPNGPAASTGPSETNQGSSVDPSPSLSPASGSTPTVDLTRTNQLLEQLVDLARNQKLPFLPKNARSANDQSFL